MKVRGIEVVLILLLNCQLVLSQNEPSLPKSPEPEGEPEGRRQGESGSGGRRPGGGGRRPGSNRPSSNNFDNDEDEHSQEMEEEDGREADSGLRPGSLLPNPPPQNAPPDTLPSEEVPAGEDAETTTVKPPTPVIFGLNHVILIIVPQFKVKIPNLPKWIGANAKVSLPITVFFDKLVIPGYTTPADFPPAKFYGPYFPNGHFVRKRNAKELLAEPNPDSESKSKKPKLILNEERYRAERVTLIPKLEKLLDSFGFGGKPCLLRAICEVHEHPLEHHGYGLVGEVLTMFFSISRSVFADSHLSEYLRAEEVGKSGDCTKYYKACPTSLFYWERIHAEENAEYDDAEFDLLQQLFMQ